jgi:SAM-dependent methyltransferase
MRLPVKEFVEYARDTYPLVDPILDVCAGWEPNYYRPLFPNSVYLKQDQIQFAPPTIDFVCDAHNMSPIGNNEIGTVLLLEALEHLQNPQRVADEVFRILRPGGYCIVTTVMTFEIHRTPYDYWRFCPDGICYIFRSFKLLELILEHHRTLPRGIWCICQKPDDNNAINQARAQELPVARTHESGKSIMKNFVKRILNKLGIDIIRLSKNPEAIDVIGKREVEMWKDHDGI